MVKPSSSRIPARALNFQPVILESMLVGKHEVAPREAASAQHLGTANVGKPVLAPYLHLPMTQAALKLSMPYSELKREYRRQGLERWPCRQINALNRKIAKLEASLPTANLWKFIKITSSIKALQDKKWGIYEKVISGHGGH